MPFELVLSLSLMLSLSPSSLPAHPSTLPCRLHARTTPRRDIMRSSSGLAEHHDNYHEFCRLLGRLKTNYQLAELVSGCVH